MKLLFASDLHGSKSAADGVAAAFRREGAERLVLLGDLLYHGPRNPIPPDYDPQAVAGVLNEHASVILAVRGNCDAEVDQLLLSFPILSDQLMILADGRTMLATHGHHHGPDNPPPHSPGDILLSGHTHLAMLLRRGDLVCLNPGSAGIPKGEYPASYLVYQNGVFTLKTLAGEALDTLAL